MKPTLAQWWEQGTLVPIIVAGIPVHVFVWDSHDGQQSDTVTLLHGWPTSSWDWSCIARDLAESRRVIAPDFLGLGRSCKGDSVPYDLRSQADMILALWQTLDVTSSAVVSHDFGTIITQELLAREHVRTAPALVNSVVWLNGSLDPSRYQPTPGQLALLDPEHGPALAQLVDQNTFVDALANVHVQRPDADELAQHWTAMSLDNGHLGSPRFLRYIPDRADDATRLLAAFTDATIPMRLIWGVDDPVSGRAQLDALTMLRPDIPVHELTATGHYPHTERHQLVAEILMDARSDPRH
jgi:pimeloyl-ACP methyl ester carboxylesterase